MTKSALTKSALFACAVSAALLAAPAAALRPKFRLCRPVSALSGLDLPVPGRARRMTATDSTELSPKLRRQIVSYSTREAPGTIVIDTPNTYLYYVLGNGQAVRYGIGVGRDGFRWSGVQHVARKAEWPDWHPPAEMVARQPYLPRFMAGGPSQPARRPRALSRQFDLSHPRHQCAVDHRRPRLVGLHPHAERGCDRPVRARECRHQGRGAAGFRPLARDCNPSQSAQVASGQLL